jgi:HK97 family phage major capsid protein
LGTQHAETSARLLAIEQKMTAPNGGDQGEVKSVGQKVVESDGFKSMKAGGNSTGKINVGSVYESKTNLINATGQNQPLVAPFIRPGIIPPGLRRLTIRDLMPNIPIASNLVEYAREVSFTSAAAMQTAEGNAKAESALSFELKYSPVQTLAHWIPVSRQLLDDAPAIQGYVNSRLLYGLKLKEEDELLNGAGTGTDLSGLITNSTAYDTTLTTVATDTFIDVISHAITQVSLSYFDASAIVLHPKDWERIKLIKTTGSASSGQYIFSDPHSADNPSLWGLPVVPTQSMAESQFLVGAFDMAAAVWDRNQATIEISREHSDFFTRNLAAILCEERLALTVFRPLALVYGGFPYGS